jgi:putative hemolysin
LVTLDELNEITGLHVEDPDVDTVGGFVTTRLGRLPAAGDEIEAEGARFHVESTTGHSVLLIRVRCPEAASYEQETPTESDPGWEGNE